MSPDLFPIQPFSIVPEAGRTEPRLWVRRLAIWSEPEKPVVRDIHLKKGLNIIWSPDPRTKDVAMGHGGGKTTLCRLFRYCLGEDSFASDTQRRRIADKLPKGLVGAEIMIEGRLWSVIRSLGFRKRDVVTEGKSIEDALLQPPSGIEPLREVITRVVLGDAATLMPRDIGEAHAWEAALACTTSSGSPESSSFESSSEDIAVLKWWEVTAAALYDLGGSSKVSALAEHPFIQALITANGRSRNVHQTLWQILNSHAVEESVTVKLKKRFAPGVFDKSADSVWHFADDWRDSCEDLVSLVDQWKAGHHDVGDVQRRYSFVTFHQSYGYEEFVEGLRPVLDRASESGQIQYEIRAGVFKDLCLRARLTPDQRFAMVIDEINRGNISKIFGELITLIEPDKREGAENAISVILPYSGESFSVPANVDIIGTMNTADRSLALLDTALRRRFEFQPLIPDTRDEPSAPLGGLRVNLGDQVVHISQMLSAINQRIEALYDRDHCIGHAYFMSLNKVHDGEERLVALQLLFSTRILPLLEEYFFEDWQKIRLVLGDNQKPKAAQFVIENQNHEEDLNSLFGNDHGLDSGGAKRRYILQAPALSNPDAYIGIYQKLSVLPPAGK
jgi:5-methylcytosine-specific restriction protein B